MLNNENDVLNSNMIQEKGKMLVQVLLLDGEIFECNLEKKAIGQCLFDMVASHLNLQEKDYFGLRYSSGADSVYWLQYDKAIRKQIRDKLCKLCFCVKFYPPDPGYLQDDITRYLLCLQLRSDIYSGKLPCSFVTHAMLGSYVAQSEFGDYDMLDSKIEYLSTLKLAPVQSAELEKEIMQLHRSHKGQTPAEAEMNYLEKVKKLAMYGVHLCPVLDSDGVAIMLGVSASGLQVYRDRLRINKFVWPKVLKVSYKRNKFHIKLRPAEFEKQVVILIFKLTSYKNAKKLWKTCVEHHTFFRLMSPDIASDHRGSSTLRSRLPKFGSKFRYSGRTQYQSRIHTLSQYDCRRNGANRNANFKRSYSTRALPSNVAEIDNFDDIRRGKSHEDFFNNENLSPLNQIEPSANFTPTAKKPVGGIAVLPPLDNVHFSHSNNKFSQSPTSDSHAFSSYNRKQSEVDKNQKYHFNDAPTCNGVSLGSSNGISSGVTMSHPPASSTARDTVCTNATTAAANKPFGATFRSISDQETPPLALDQLGRQHRQHALIRQPIDLSANDTSSLSSSCMYALGNTSIESYETEPYAPRGQLDGTKCARLHAPSTRHQDTSGDSLDRGQCVPPPSVQPFYSNPSALETSGGDLENLTVLECEPARIGNRVSGTCARNPATSAFFRTGRSPTGQIATSSSRLSSASTYQQPSAAATSSTRHMRDADTFHSYPPPLSPLSVSSCSTVSFCEAGNESGSSHPFPVSAFSSRRNWDARASHVTDRSAAPPAGTIGLGGSSAFMRHTMSPPGHLGLSDGSDVSPDVWKAARDMSTHGTSNSFNNNTQRNEKRYGDAACQEESLNRPGVQQTTVTTRMAQIHENKNEPEETWGKLNEKTFSSTITTSDSHQEQTVLTQHVQKTRSVLPVVPTAEFRARAGNTSSVAPQSKSTQPSSVQISQDRLANYSDTFSAASEPKFKQSPTADPTKLSGGFSQSLADESSIVSSQVITSRQRTVETITYKTEKDGIVETKVEQKITVQSDGGESQEHDDALRHAIEEAAHMDPHMTVEKIEVCREHQ